MVFNGRFTISEMKNKFMFSPPGKRFPTAVLELRFTNRYTTNVRSTKLT